MTKEEYAELSGLFDGSNVAVSESDIDGKKIPFARLKALLSSSAAAPTEEELDRRECYPEDRDLPQRPWNSDARRREGDDLLEELLDRVQVP